MQHREHERLRAQLIFRISGIACIEYDRQLNSRNGVAPGEMHLDSSGESRGFDGWEIKSRDIADLRQFAPVHGRDRLPDCRRSAAAISGQTILTRRSKNARKTTL